MSDTAPPSILVGEHRVNARGETLRVSLDHFKGIPLANFRKGFIGDDGVPRPGRGGFAIHVRHLTRLSELVNEALERAKRDGLIDGEGDA